MRSVPAVLAHGPWRAEQIDVRWLPDPFEPRPEAAAAADEAVAALRARGSPSHDGLSGRLAGYATAAGRLELELQPARWALRLVGDRDARSLSALCVVRDTRGRWLAGRRATWLATWAGRWALGAGGAVDVGEHPAHTLTRELAEEWSVAPQRYGVEALVELPSGMVLVVGMAWLAPGAQPTPDAEHDALAWWPAEVADWPPEADQPLRRMGRLLAASQ